MLIPDNKRDAITVKLSIGRNADSLIIDQVLDVDAIYGIIKLDDGRYYVRQFWECNCKTDYVHAPDVEVCANCGTKLDDGYAVSVESFLSAVVKLGKGK